MEKALKEYYYKPIISLRIPKKLLKELEERAKKERVNRTALIISLINKAKDL